MRNLCLNRVMFSLNVVFEDFALRSLDVLPLIWPVLESFCRFEVRVHFKNIFFFFFFFLIFRISDKYIQLFRNKKNKHNTLFPPSCSE